MSIPYVAVEGTRNNPGEFGGSCCAIARYYARLNATQKQHDEDGICYDQQEFGVKLRLVERWYPATEQSELWMIKIDPLLSEGGVEPDVSGFLYQKLVPTFPKVQKSGRRVVSEQQRMSVGSG